jgi:hypothetical protein
VDKRSVWTYASDPWGSSANGQIRNIIFREAKFAPTLVPTQAPTNGKPINPPVEFLGPTEAGTTISKGQQIGSGIALPDEYQVQLDFMPFGIVSGSQDEILHVTSYTGSGQDAQESMVPAVYLSSTGSLFVQWQIYKSGVGSVTLNTPLQSGQWHQIFITISQVLYSMDIEVYDNTGKLLESSNMKFNAKLDSSNRNVWVWAADSWSSAANGQVRNVIFREYAFRPTHRRPLRQRGRPGSTAILN